MGPGILILFRGCAYSRAGAFLKQLLVPILVFGGVVCSLAQIIPQKRSATIGRSGQAFYALEGRVVVYRDGSPVQKVQVLLIDSEGTPLASSYTDDDGIFAFYDVPTGRYLLTASHPEYEEKTLWVDLYGGPQRDLQIVLSKSRREADAPAGSSVPVWALQIPPKARREYDKGVKKLQESDPQKSLPHFEAAIRLYPQYAAAYSALGAGHLRLGNAQAAQAAFEQALNIDENLAHACLGLGALYSAQRRYSEAEKQLLRARQLKPDDWRVHYELGQCYWGAEDWAKAEASLRRALELHSDFPRLHLLLINVLALQEKYPDTLAQMETFLKLFPEDPFAPPVRQKRDLLKAQLQAGVSSAPPKPP